MYGSAEVGRGRSVFFLLLFSGNLRVLLIKCVAVGGGTRVMSSLNYLLRSVCRLKTLVGLLSIAVLLPFCCGSAAAVRGWEVWILAQPCLCMRFLSPRFDVHSNVGPVPWFLLLFCSVLFHCCRCIVPSHDWSSF